MRRGSGLGLCGRLWLAAFLLSVVVLTFVPPLTFVPRLAFLLTRLALVALTFVPPLALVFLLLTRALLAQLALLVPQRPLQTLAFLATSLTFVPPLALVFLLLTRALLGRAHKFPSMQFA